jgi:hypothetical protein
LLGFKATTTFDQGLKSTVECYVRTHRKVLAV